MQESEQDLGTSDVQDDLASEAGKVLSIPFEEVSLTNNSEKEYQMADIVTGTTTGFVNNTQDTILKEVSDGNVENMKGFDRVNADVLRSGWQNADATKDARHDINSRMDATRADLSQQIDAVDDTLTKQASDYFVAGQQYAFQAARDLAALKAGTDMAFFKLGTDIQTQGALGQAATALESAKVAAAIALGQSQLSKEIFADGQKTRDLVNDLKYHDLNRALVERNAELIEEREGGRYWKHHANQVQNQGQWAAVQSQLQAFASQLQETRQGMVNFGTMAGVGQTSTSNNVR